MNLLEFIKRAVPFLGAFAIGSIISSSFASLPLPTLKLDQGWKSRKYCVVKRENHYLKRKIHRLERKLSKEEQKLVNHSVYRISRTKRKLGKEEQELVEIAKTKLAKQHNLPTEK